MLNKLSLRLRLTLLITIILTLICVVLTLTSINSAKTIFSGQGMTGVEAANPVVENADQVAPIEMRNKKFAVNRFMYMTILILLGAGSSYYVVGKALKPISKLSSDIEHIDETGLHKRVYEPKSKDEVASLAILFNRMMERLDNAFTQQKQFSQNVAHELKTPITSILATIDVLQMDDNPSTEEMLETIAITKENTQRLLNIVYDILSIYEKFDEHEFETFDSEYLIHEIHKELRDEMNSKNIAFTSSGNIQIKGNKALIFRAFFNLIQNATKYNKQNGMIDVHCEGNKVTITDSGIGIPEASIHNVFTPFYCVDDSRSRALGGSGLGLSIVKTILDKHHFNIEIQSQEHIYTKIIITL